MVGKCLYLFCFFFFARMYLFMRDVDWEDAANDNHHPSYFLIFRLSEDCIYFFFCISCPWKWSTSDVARHITQVVFYWINWFRCFLLPYKPLIKLVYFFWMIFTGKLFRKIKGKFPSKKRREGARRPTAFKLLSIKTKDFCEVLLISQKFWYFPDFLSSWAQYYKTDTARSRITCSFALQGSDLRDLDLRSKAKNFKLEALPKAALLGRKYFLA